MTDADYANVLARLVNTLVQAEFLLYSLELSAREIGRLYVNADKTEFTSFIQEGAISNLSSKPQRLVDLFTYLGNNISSTERNVNRGSVVHC